MNLYCKYHHFFSTLSVNIPQLTLFPSLRAPTNSLVFLTLMKGDEGVEAGEEGADGALLGKRRH